MKSINCNVIQDLLPSYCDKISSKETNVLVEEHLKSCINCKKKLESINKELDIDTISKKQEDKEINFLKKYNRKLTILKNVATVLSIIVVIMWSILGINYVIKIFKYKNATYIYEIIDTAYKNISEIEKSNNYSYSFLTDYIDGDYTSKNILLYKDGYYKEDYKGNNDFNFTNYGIRLKDNSVYVQYHDNELKSGITIEHHVVDKNALAYYHNKEISDYINSDIRDELYEGKEYYVIKFRQYNIYDALSETELWINKDNMLLYKISNITFGNESIYTWTINNVTDEEVKVKDDSVYLRLQEHIEKFK